MRSLAVPGTSYFVATAGQPRVRRPRDILTAIVGLLLVFWAVIAIDQPPSWELSLTELVQSSPPWRQTLLEGAYSLSLIYSLVLLGALLFGGRERRAALRDVSIVAVGTAALVILLSFLINDAWPYVLPEIDLEDPVPHRDPHRRQPVCHSAPPPLRLAGDCHHGLCLHQSRVCNPVAHNWLVWNRAIHRRAPASCGRLISRLSKPGDGGRRSDTSRRPESRDPGHPVPNLGCRPLCGNRRRWRARGGQVHGRDAFDSQLAAKVWHTLWYRETGPAVSYSRLQAVEHEALMTVVANGVGVNVPRLAALGAASSEIALISFRESGVALPDLDPDKLTDDHLVETWSQVRLLHDRSMSHGSLRASAVHVSRDGPMITDLALGSLAADEADQGNDIVELLFSLTALVGEERAFLADS